ncbi:MAG: DMT family transporter [Bacteroidales bacterium]|jgi:drug/metabolite transporter (DMT)-like permease|nr:DMT family transporter [Bacteroidales bacterium]
MQEYLGESAALMVAVFWTITALAFERASLKIGSLSLNIIRLFMGLFFLTLYVWIRRGMPFPTDATGFNWIWLGISGLVGFVFGDLFLFKSYTLIGSRTAMLIMTLAPPIAALAGWITLGETLTPLNMIGMFLTMFGISLAIFTKSEGKKGFSIKMSAKGVLFAFLGAAGQGIGLVLSKYGMRDYDPFAATQIRLIAGIIGFAILTTYLGRWKKVFNATKHKSGMSAAALGSFFGPFLGVSFSLVAIRYTETGIAATIMAIVPILIIPPAILIYKEKVKLFEIIGSLISITGVALLFLS